MPAVFVALACVLSAKPAKAQSTIFNIPTTDTVDYKKAYFEFDFLSQAPGPDVGSMIYIYNPCIVVGLPNNVEAGLNFPVYHSGDASPSNLAYIQPNIKWKFYKNDDKGIALAAGGVLNTPLNQREGQATWGYVYGLVSMKYKGDHGPRVHAGGYGVIANDDPTSGPVSFIGKRGGAILGYEQPLGGPVSFVADWFSTKNSLGYFTPGVSIVLPASGLLNIGYSIGNDSWEDSNATKNRYFFAYYGVTF